MKPIIIVLTLYLTSFSTQNISATTYIIGASGDFPTLSAVASSVNPGDSCLLQSQVFADGTQFWNGINGTASDPIVIIAQVPQGAVFQGGTEAIHLVDCSYIEINGLVIEQQTGNGINIDDGGDYSTPSTNITVRNCVFRDMAASGNNDLLKMSGVDFFLIENCSFTNGGAGGSGIDFVGCHWGTVQDCFFDNAGVSGIQCKGGSHNIRIQRNVLKNMSQRALNLGGSTGLQYFRPPLPDPIVGAFEAAELEVYSNVFVGSWAPIAYVGCVNVRVYNNTIHLPQNWVIRILQETTVPGFLPCGDNEFRNNIVYQATDLTEVNIGPNTDPGSFIFSNNVWYNESSGNWTPNLPVTDVDQVIGDPLFVDANNENFDLLPGSPAIAAGINLGEPASDFLQMAFFDPPSSGAYEGGTGTLAEENIVLNGFIRNDEAILEWHSTSSHELLEFEVEYATESTAWERIAELPIKEGKEKYGFIHFNPAEGLNLYRVKQVYQGGEFRYSNILILDHSRQQVHVYPNPVVNQLFIEANDLNVLKFNILNSDGQTLKSIKSKNSCVDVSGLAQGWYFLEIVHENGTELYRFLKM